MANFKKTIKIRLPLTYAEKASISQLISVYPKACNHVSKFIYKKRYLSQQFLLKVLYAELKAKYEIDYRTAKSVIKTVVSKYKERKTLHKKWKRIRFHTNECYFHWGIDYMLAENQFFINVGREKAECIVVGYDRYFNIAPVFFGVAKVKRRLFGYDLLIPVNLEIGKGENRVLLRASIWILWMPIKNKLVVR